MLIETVQGISEHVQTPLLKTHKEQPITRDLVGTTCRLELDILPNFGQNHNPRSKIGKRIVKKHSYRVTWSGWWLAFFEGDQESDRLIQAIGNLPSGCVNGSILVNSWK